MQPAADVPPSSPPGPIPGRAETVARARARGLAVVAALPYHYPRALLRAHGCHAMEVWAPTSVGTGADPASGRRHFQSYTCSIVTRGTAFLLEQGMPMVDAVLVPHGCDALQGMGSVLTDFVTERPPILTLYAPRSRRPVDRDYYIAELRSLGTRLSELTGIRPAEADWARAFAAEDAADDALRQMYARRWDLALSDHEFLRAVRSREYLLAEDFVALVNGLPAGPAPRPGVPVALSGIIAEPLELLDQLNEAGAHVAADDLSTGSRRMLPPSTLSEPYERMADQFLRGPADPTRTDPVQDRADRLIGLIRDSAARGLLVYLPTFCEPELFYLPMIRQRVMASGHPVLAVEFEIGSSLPSQTVTRIEAFVESLGAAGPLELSELSS